ncbi:MAG: hypothetical protein ACP5NY_08395 [Thermocladium sp.]
MGVERRRYAERVARLLMAWGVVALSRVKGRKSFIARQVIKS